MYAFNRVVLAGFIARMDREGILTGQEAATWLKSAADQFDVQQSDQQVGAMLRELADTVTDPEAKPRWTPRVIDGGKKD
jgi:hypothetical protein